MKSGYRFLLNFILLLCLSATASAADVVSENLVFLKEDGRSYLLQRSMRTDSEQYDFYLEKSTGPASIYYVDPPDNSWELDQADVNLLKFNSGTFTVMYPGNYGERVTVDAENVYTLQTRDDVEREDGHFGSWNSPGNFTRFVQAWVIPESFRILDYKSNREGEWVERNNTLTFYATDVNDLIFTVRYQLIDGDSDGVADVDDRCRDTAAGVVVDASGCEADRDNDGVMDLDDRCAATPKGAVVNEQGCELDSDADGIVDSQDQCPDTVEGAAVDRSGCEQDCDGDGVPDSKDKCPGTPAGTEVNAQGCEVDEDGDGVPDSKDKCPGTPAGTEVNAQGCEDDSDNDGVVNSEDLCPDTVAGVTVDATGCDTAQPIELYGVQFQFDSDKLTAQSEVILDGVAAVLINHPELRLEVAGHTDSAGDDMFNLELSQRRARTVRAYLIAKGVDAGNLTARGYGEEQPVESNANSAGRAANRRVELIRVDR
jgi:outer membrane protein OmpA-like peptidoglycan-associated protein